MIYNDKKLCIKCFKEKNPFEFRRSSTSKDGRMSYCIPCSETYRKANDEANKEEISRTARAWREKNKPSSGRKPGRPRKTAEKPQKPIKRTLRPRMRKTRRKYIEERRKIMYESELL